MKQEKIIIVLKDLSKYKKFGGIGNYYIALEKHFVNNIIYFKGHSSINEFGLLRSIFYIAKDYLSFFKLLLKEKDIRIVHVTPSFDLVGIPRDSIFLLISFLFRKKIIVFIRGWNQKAEKIITSHFNSLFKFIYGKADVFIVLSDQFKSKLRNIGIKQPIYIETTTFDNDLIRNVESFKASKSNSFSILFLARIEKNKGIFELVDAYKLLKPKYSFIKLVIAGDGSALKLLKKYVEKEAIKDIYFTGFIKDKEKVSVLTNSDIFVFPTYHGEGMPNSVLEAMAFGLPVVTRTVGGLNDFFEDGKMGFITESKYPRVFVDMIEKLIVDKKHMKEISDYNKQYARKNFMASNVAKRIERIYSEVLAGNAKGRSWKES